jgi:hypothetical protein
MMQATDSRMTLRSLTRCLDLDGDALQVEAAQQCLEQPAQSPNAIIVIAPPQRLKAEQVAGLRNAIAGHTPGV